MNHAFLSIHIHGISLIAMGFTFQMPLTTIQSSKVGQIYTILLFFIYISFALWWLILFLYLLLTVSFYQPRLQTYLVRQFASSHLILLIEMCEFVFCIFRATSVAYLCLCQVFATMETWDAYFCKVTCLTCSMRLPLFGC